MGEHAAGFVEQWRLVGVTLGKVSQNEPFDSCLTCDRSRFQCRAVVALVGLDVQAVVVGGFVVQPVHSLDALDDAAREFGVAAVGITDGRIGCRRQLTVGNDDALGGDPVLTLPQAVDRIVWHTQTCDLLADDVAQLGLVLEQKAHGWNAVNQRKRRDGYGIILIDEALVGVDDVEVNLKGTLAAEVVQHLTK